MGRSLVKGLASTLFIFFFFFRISTAARRQINHHPRYSGKPKGKSISFSLFREKDLRFLMVPNVFETKTSMLSDLGKDLNNIYTGYANVTGGFFPFLLKGSTYTDTIYGALGNRSGMIIVGAALLGGTGLSHELVLG